MRVPTLHTARQAFQSIEAQQARQAHLQGQLASGQRVRSPGDDPLAAAQAELARSRLERISQDQGSAHLSATILGVADGALAIGIEALQSAREGLVAAGNPAYTVGDREALAIKLRGARDTLMQVANSADGSSGYVFAGQGSSTAPMAGASNPTYDAAAGQQLVGEGGRYAVTVDGRDTFMAVPQGNGVFVTSSVGTNQGKSWINAGSVSDPTALTGDAYTVRITGTTGNLQYEVLRGTGAEIGDTPIKSGPFAPGDTIEVEGQQFSIGGTPVPDDAFEVVPAGTKSVFATLDEAIRVLQDPSLPSHRLSERLEGLQVTLDNALNGLIMVRSRVGAQINAIDEAVAASEQLSLAASTRRSKLEDVDMMQGISELQQTQSQLEAALRSYTSLSSTSLFKLMG